MTQKSTLKGRISASKTMDSLVDYSNAGPMFSVNTVNSTFLNNQNVNLSQTGGSGTTSIPPSGTTNSLLKNVIGTPSMSSSTSSGYGSQAVSLGNLTNDDALSLRSMSVDETPDLDRSSSASPPAKSSGGKADQVTTPYTPSGTQKRFNPFMKDMESSTSSTSTLVKTPLTPTKNHPLAEENSDEAEEPTVSQQPPEPSAAVNEYHEEEVENNNSAEMVNKNEAPLPDWVVLGESVLIRPTNSSGVISFIGPTHFQVREIYIN